MEVIKRNGQKEIVKFDKITARISNLCSKDDLKKADPIVIAQKMQLCKFTMVLLLKN